MYKLNKLQLTMQWVSVYLQCRDRETDPHLPLLTAPDDYTTLSEERSITRTITGQCFDIAIEDDNESEHPEKLLVVGSIVSGDFTFNPLQTEVWIIDGSKEHSV